MITECYHSPRRLLEPCSAGYSCDENAGLNCRAIDHICTVTCSSIQESEDLKANEDLLKKKQSELDDAKGNLENAMEFIAAKCRGETLFIAEELQAYYSEETSFCVDISVNKLLAARRDLCDPANYDDGEFEMVGDCANVPPAKEHIRGCCVENQECRITKSFEPPECCEGTHCRLKGLTLTRRCIGPTKRVCTEHVTKAEVIVHDNIIIYKKLRKEIEALIEKEKEIKANIKKNATPECILFYKAIDVITEEFESAVEAVVAFVDEMKCTIIKILLFLVLVANAVDNLAKTLPYIGSFITTMRAQPQCQTKVTWEKFHVPIPGGALTGKMVLEAMEALLCFIGDLDDALYFFKDACSTFSVVGQLTNALIAGLCGKPGSAIVAIIEPFIICNLWDCGENYNVRVDVSFIFMPTHIHMTILIALTIFFPPQLLDQV